MKIFVKRRIAFTLVEMLLSASLVGVVGIAAYSSLSIGLKAWERGRLLSSQTDVVLFMDRFAQDLRNAIKHSQLKFEGASKRIVIPTLVHLPMARKGSDNVVAYVDQIGLVEYGYDYRLKSIYRKTAGYGQSQKNEFNSPRELASSIESLHFYYLKKTDNGLSERRLDNDTLPDAVRVEVIFRDITGRRVVSERLYLIPASTADEPEVTKGWV